MDSDPFLIINPNADSGKTGKKINKHLPQIKEHFGDIEYEITTKIKEEKNIIYVRIEIEDLPVEDVPIALVDNST